MGIFLVVGLSQIRKEVPFILEDATNELTADMREIISSCHQRVLELDEAIARYTQKIEQFCKQNAMCGRLMQLPGVGPMSASIIYATVGDPLRFKNGRHFAAYLGLVPKEHSSGGKHCLMSISKRGDRYIRSLLIHGGRSVVKGADNKSDYVSCWVTRIKKERGYNKAAVAVANKNARHMWAIMAYDDNYINRHSGVNAA